MTIDDLVSEIEDALEYQRCYTEGSRNWETMQRKIDKLAAAFDVKLAEINQR